VQVSRNRCFRAGEGAIEDANMKAGVTVVDTVRFSIENGNCRSSWSILQILMEVCLFQTSGVMRQGATSD
jgi:hypothetical protein